MKNKEIQNKEINPRNEKKKSSEKIKCFSEDFFDILFKIKDLVPLIIAIAGGCRAMR